MGRQAVSYTLVFLILFLLAGLLSFSPEDPSVVLSSGRSGEVHNWFGVVGAQIAGLFVGLFGLGAFVVPVVLAVASWHTWKRDPWSEWLVSMSSGLSLLILTGAFLELWGDRVSVLGHMYFTGGVVGGVLAGILASLFNSVGSGLLLGALWLVALTLFARLSLTDGWNRMSAKATELFVHVKHRFEIQRQRRKKARQRARRAEIGASLPTTPPRIKKAARGPVQPVPKQETFDFGDGETYQLPRVSFLDDPPQRPRSVDAESLRMQSRLLEKKLEDFGILGKVQEVSPGPVITTFEYQPAQGVRVNRIMGLSDDLSMALRASSIRIGMIPGKGAVGIEVPNDDRELVAFKEVVASPAFEKIKSRLAICLGKDIHGNPTVADLARMPHLLIAGATGSGKSVALNAIISSLLYRATPEQVKFVMIDPKRIELSNYNGIPHLITPVVTDPKKATNALHWAVQEMERRYGAMERLHVRNLAGYNSKMARLAKKPEEAPEGLDLEPLPQIVVVVDELADLMMVASRDVEAALMRLAQMARAAGMHLIIATQRPSVDVLTGTIKANFPTRVSFQVSSRTDSRTILDTNGAETLLGNGDMLYMPPGVGRLQRIHGAYISEEELGRVLNHVRRQGAPQYDTSVTEAPDKPEDGGDAEIEYDEKYDEALAIVTETRQASISMLQRRLRIGYNRAARIIDVMEKEGVVGPSDGVTAREVLVPAYED
ncbi:MAG: DNA translocase FtsK [Desulfatibacillaceae bacterium]